ncbi:MAG: flavin reductase family protein [Thermaerobacter sp.]|nr:flavin reductase family protein [Thermaerobacter sp.]
MNYAARPLMVEVQPKVLYYGTPVVILSTLNPDGSTNIAPISSSWALGNRLVIGVGLGSQSADNLMVHPECVLNVPDVRLFRAVEALAPLTGADPVPEGKQAMGFRHEAQKFAASGLTPVPSSVVRSQRIAECPLQIEALVRHLRISGDSPAFAVVEVEAVRIHAHAAVVHDPQHINPVTWRPLIYSFRHYFTLGEELGRTFRAEV